MAVAYDYATPEQYVGRPHYQPIGSPIPWWFDEMGGLYVSQLMPKYAALAANGNLFFTTHTVATAVAPLQVVPTTTAAFVVNNVSSANMVIPIMAGAMLAGGTAAGGLTLFGLSTQTPLAAQLSADGAGVTRSPGHGSGTFCDFSKTVAGGWCPIGGKEATANTTPGSGLVVPLDGQFIVRPGSAFGLHVLAGAGTNAVYCFSVFWAEVPITLG